MESSRVQHRRQDIYVDPLSARIPSYSTHVPALDLDLLTVTAHLLSTYAGAIRSKRRRVAAGVLQANDGCNAWLDMSAYVTSRL